MLDIHTHILPSIDDGSKDAARSCTMLAAEAKQGIGTVVCTPHFYADRESPERFLLRRAESAEKLAAALDGNRRVPEILLGAEVAYFPGISRADDIDALCIGNTGCMLIEMPFCKWDDTMLEEIGFLRDCMGIQPILAHVERYLRFQPAGMLRQLCEDGIWIQANASFFLEWKTAWRAMRMLKKGHIHFIGSDCHDMKRRPPNMGAAMEKIERKLGKSARQHLEYMEKLLLEE